DEPRSVAHDDVVDLARSMDERADLPPCLLGRLGERSKKLGRRHPLERDFAAVDVLEGLDRAPREAPCIPVDFRHCAASDPFPSLVLGWLARPCKVKSLRMATYTDLKLPEAREVGTEFGLRVAEVVAVPAGSVNSNYRFVLDDGRTLFARIYEEQDRTGAE